MAKDSGDMLMWFKRKGASTAMDGEGQSTIDHKDEFTSDFTHGKFFEVEDLDLDLGLRDEDTSSDDNTDPKNKSKTKSRGNTPFSRLYQTASMPDASQLSTMFPVQMQEVGFSRRMGVSSPLMFMLCFQTQPFDQVALVRRKVGGLTVSNSGNFDGTTNIASFPYLRIDFYEVLITSVGWDAGGDDEVKEKYKFICRKIKVQYKQQEHHGKLKPAVGSGELTLVKSA